MTNYKTDSLHPSTNIRNDWGQPWPGQEHKCIRRPQKEKLFIEMCGELCCAVLGYHVSSCLEFVSSIYQDISHHFNSPDNWNYTNGNGSNFQLLFIFSMRITVDWHETGRNETNETIVISNLDKLWDPPQFAYFRHMWWVVRHCETSGIDWLPVGPELTLSEEVSWVKLDLMIVTN